MIKKKVLYLFSELEYCFLFQVSRYFQLKEKTATAFFPFDGKKNVVDSYKKKATIGSTNINHSRSVCDGKTLKWLKRTKKTKKLFINYFAAGNLNEVCILLKIF